MIGALLKLHRLTDDINYYNKAELALKQISGTIGSNPAGMTSAVLALDYFLNDKIEIVLVGQSDEREEIVNHLYQSYLPDRVIAFSSDSNDNPLFVNRNSADGKVTAYLCVNSVCNLPVSTLAELKEQLALIK